MPGKQRLGLFFSTFRDIESLNALNSPPRLSHSALRAASCFEVGRTVGENGTQSMVEGRARLACVICDA